MKERLIKWILDILFKNHSHLFPQKPRTPQLHIITCKSQRILSRRELLIDPNFPLGIPMIKRHSEQEIREEILREVSKKITFFQTEMAQGEFCNHGDIRIVGYIDLYVPDGVK